MVTESTDEVKSVGMTTHSDWNENHEDSIRDVESPSSLQRQLTNHAWQKKVVDFQFDWQPILRRDDEHRDSC
jgi:hypothetical protein